MNQQFPLHSSIRGSRVVAASVPECRTSSKVQQLSGSSLDSQVKQQSIYFNCSSETNLEAVAHSADGAIDIIALLIATQWTLSFYGPKENVQKIHEGFEHKSSAIQTRIHTVLSAPVASRDQRGAGKVRGQHQTASCQSTAG